MRSESKKSGDCDLNAYQVTYGVRGCKNRIAYWNETNPKNNVNGESPHSKQGKAPSLPHSNCDYDHSSSRIKFLSEMLN